MSLTPQFLDELKSRITLSEIVGRRVNLRRAGREFQACCPFHKEKTPSFTVNDQKGFYHCFGCGAHGDAIGFLMDHDNLGFMEAVEQLAGQAGMQMPAPDPKAKEKAERASTLHDIMAAAAEAYTACLMGPEGQEARAYLAARGLDEAAIRQFGLGYAPRDGSAVLAKLKSLGAKEGDIEALGLMRRPEDGRAPYAFFRDRVLFPVLDRKARVVAFGARLMQGDGPKYINSPESPIFSKGYLLYGMERAHKAAAQGAPILLAEGYMDVIALVRAGFNGAVAPLGTAVTEAQIEAMWRMAPDDETRGMRMPVLCFDGDNAGRRAAVRAMHRALPLLAPGRSLAFSFLPEGEDPDSLIAASGAAGMQRVLDASISLADLLWQSETAGRKFDTPEARAGLKKTLLTRLAEIADGDVQRYYRDDMFRRLDQHFGRGRANRFAKKHPDSRIGGESTSGKLLKSVPSAEAVRARVLLAACINYPQILEEFGEVLAMLDMPGTALEKLRDGMITYMESDSDLDVEALRQHLLSSESQEECGRCLSNATYLQGRFAAPGSDLETVRAEWQVRAEDYARATMGADVERMKAIFADQMTDENMARLAALSRQAQRVESDDEEH